MKLETSLGFVLCGNRVWVLKESPVVNDVNENLWRFPISKVGMNHLNHIKRNGIYWKIAPNFVFESLFFVTIRTSSSEILIGFNLLAQSVLCTV